LYKTNISQGLLTTNQQ